MAYRSHLCSSTLCYYVCINVFCTLLVLSILLPFMLSAPCPFNAPFPFYTFMLLCSHSFFTPQSHSTTTPIYSFFNIIILSVHLLHAIFFSLLHPLPPQSTPHWGVFFFHFPLPQLSHLLCAMLSLSILHLLLIVSALPDHHGNSLASLAFSPMHPSSLGVILRFLNFSLEVETLRLLCYRRAQPLCCSYRLQLSSICQLPL
jgi:hypothetical protein